MIIAYVGVPGAGKSLALVARAQKALKEGREVYSNFPIKGCYEFTMDDLVNCAFPEGCTIIIDEAGRWFNSRNWSNLPPEVFDYFTMHRHLDMQMYVGVQAFNRIDSSLREVIELTYVARKHLFWHSYRGYYEVARVGNLKGEEDLKYMLLWPRKYYKYYDTHAMRTAFVGKPLIEKKLYSPLPLTIKEKLIIKKNNLIQRFKNRRDNDDELENELDYLDELEMRNREE